MKLVLKENIDLKELEKFGFKKEDEDYYYDFVPYNENDNTGASYICVGHFGNTLSFGSVQGEDCYKAVNILFDLIQAGLVEKVEK